MYKLELIKAGKATAKERVIQAITDIVKKHALQQIRKLWPCKYFLYPGDANKKLPEDSTCIYALGNNW